MVAQFRKCDIYGGYRTTPVIRVYNPSLPAVYSLSLILSMNTSDVGVAHLNLLLVGLRDVRSLQLHRRRQHAIIW